MDSMSHPCEVLVIRTEKDETMSASVFNDLSVCKHCGFVAVFLFSDIVTLLFASKFIILSNVKHYCKSSTEMYKMSENGSG